MLAHRTIHVSIISALLIVVIAISFVAGFLLGKTHLDKQLIAQNQEEKAVLTQELQKFYPAVPETITRVNGAITDLLPDGFKMQANIQVRALPENGQPIYEQQTKTVKITPATKIFKLNPGGKIIAGQGMPVKNLSQSDLQIGQQVACQSATNLNLKALDTFDAQSVEVLF